MVVTDDLETKAALYRADMMKIMAALTVIHTIDVPGYIEKINRTEAFGCFVDPSLYRQKSQAMLEDKSILEAALPLWKLSQKLKEGNNGPKE